MPRASRSGPPILMLASSNAKTYNNKPLTTTTTTTPRVVFCSFNVLVCYMYICLTSI